MSGSDVKAVTLTSTGAIFAGPARIRGVYFATASSGSPALVVKDGATGTTVLSIVSTTSQTDSISIPDEGIRCETNPQVTTLTAIDSITFFIS